LKHIKRYKSPFYFFDAKKVRKTGEEELGIESENEYWKEGEIIPPHSGPFGEKLVEQGLTITYTYKPNEEESKK